MLFLRNSEILQFVSFPHVITDLADELERKNLTAGRCINDNLYEEFNEILLETS